MGGIDSMEWMTFLQGAIMASAMDEKTLTDHDGTFDRPFSLGLLI